MRFAKRLRVGKVERYEFDISTWLDTEAITSATVSLSAQATQSGAVDISGGVIGFYLEGVSVGLCTIDVSYSTATRTDCEELFVYVEAC